MTEDDLTKGKGTTTKDEGRVLQPEPPSPSTSPLASTLTSTCPFPGVLLTPLTFASDPRGWLTELFRSDTLEAVGKGEAQPLMGYVSMTKPGVARGPHEHREQTDLIAFLGPSDFEVTLWDNRQGSPTFGQRESFVLGQSYPATLMVPPGVVHAYRNVGDVEGWVLNFPNRLFKGPDRKDPVNEIRYESDPSSRFTLETKEKAGV